MKIFGLFSYNKFLCPDTEQLTKWRNLYRVSWVSENTKLLSNISWNKQSKLMKTGNHATHQAACRQFSMVARDEEEKTKPQQKSRRWAENSLDELPGPSSLPIPSAMSCQKLLAAWPASPPWMVVTAAKTKETGLQESIGGVEKERRRDAISVGIEEGGIYWQRRREDRTWC